MSGPRRSACGAPSPRTARQPRQPARPRRIAWVATLAVLLVALATGCGSDAPSGATSDDGWVVYSWDGTCGSSPPGASDTQGICLVRTDGTEPHRILLDLADSKKPDWSHDGRRLAFTAPDDTGAQRIWTSAADGSEAAPIETDADCDVEEAYPAWSPDDSEIAFMCLHGPQERADLDVVDLDTGATRTVVAGTAETNAWAPRWSPDGSSLTFNLEHVTDGTFDGSAVATAPASGGTPTVVSPKDLAYAGYPDWSPDGSSIAFATYGIGEFPTGAEGASNLYTVAPDGTGLRQLTRYAAGGPRAGWASWTPDGKQLVFTHVDETGARRIAFFDPDGTGPRVVDGVRANMPRVQP